MAIQPFSPVAAEVLSQHRTLTFDIAYISHANGPLLASDVLPIPATLGTSVLTNVPRNPYNPEYREAKMLQQLGYDVDIVDAAFGSESNALGHNLLAIYVADADDAEVKALTLNRRGSDLSRSIASGISPQAIEAAGAVGRAIRQGLEHLDPKAQQIAVERAFLTSHVCKWIQLGGSETFPRENFRYEQLRKEGREPFDHDEIDDLILTHFQQAMRDSHLF